MEDITLIYIYRNKEIERVKNSLESLLNQNVNNFHVLFVDYGSDDNYSKEINGLCQNYPFCKYLFIDSDGKLWNRAEALNYGIKHCETKYIFTADVDLVFKAGFIDSLYRDVETKVAKFYAVGYLNESSSKHINLSEINKLSFEKSEDFALGMVLVEKTELEKINGYNAFYSIWGLEDNDLKYRLEQNGSKAVFINNVLMLHQYHPPVNSTHDYLPNGWVQYSKDYFEYNGKHGNFNTGLSQLVYPLLRPAKELFQDKASIKKTITARKLFVRHELIHAILAANKKALFYDIFFQADQFQRNSKVMKVIGIMNRVFKGIKIPIYAQSSFLEQYSSKANVYAEICFVLKCFETNILDYYLKENENSFELIIVKK